MFGGPAGLGKQVFARTLGQALLCGQRDGDGFACGQCPSCVQFVAGTHPDFAQLAPQGAGQSIPVDAVREFSGQLHLTSRHRRGRVGLICDAERMTIAAFNSLLKTLEEPPAGSYLLLVTSRTTAMPATVRSRCQIYRFQRPDDQTLRDWLTDQGIDPALAPQLGSAPLLAAGRIGEGYPDRRAAWIDGLMTLARDRGDVVSVAEAWLNDDLTDILDWFYVWLLDLLRLQVGLSSTVLTNADNTANLNQLAATAASADLERLACATIQTRALAETQANKQLLIETLLIRWRQTWQKAM